MSAVDVARANEQQTAEGSGARRKLDGWTFALWSAAVLIPAMALAAANWTDDLGLIPWIAIAGLGLGAVLVLSRFGGRSAFLLALGYGTVILLWRLTETLDPGMLWRERAIDLAARVATFFTVVVAGEPSHDSLMFVLAMGIVFWGMAVLGTWWLFRRGGLWLAVLLPGLAVFLNVYYYRYGSRLQLYLPAFLLIALALIVRTELSGRRRGWEQRRAQVSTDVSSRVTQAGVVAAMLLVGTAWLGPRVPDAQVESPTGVSGSQSPFSEFFSDALAGLRAPVNLYGETFGSMLTLGAGRPPGERAVFRARALDNVPPDVRLYWRARAYDTYRDGEWQVAVGAPTAFRPRDGNAVPSADAGRVPLEFTVSSFVPAMRLLYVPAKIAWVNRSADFLELTEAGDVVDVLEATSAETLLPGDSYRVRSLLAAPLAGDLRRAGTNYPSWVEDSYLPLPPDFPARIGQLARQITASAENPYDQAAAITGWLRENMQYQRDAPAPPPGVDPVEWFLFDTRLGFCDYYASAAILMLRSLGVPSRLAAGYAEGEFDPESRQYFVSEADLHSWPEVYFPGYGWIEFEPTASQPPLERAQGQTEGDAAGGASAEDPGDTAAGAGGSPAIDPLDQFADIEEVVVPEAEVPRTPWLGYGALALLGIAVVVYVSPARRIAAGWAVASAHRGGRRLPGRIEEWAEGPLTPASSTFRRLAPWPARLGFRLKTDATPHERGRAITEVLPDSGEAVAAIVDAYSAERYGGIPAPQGDIRRAWRALRPRLYRAGLVRLVNRILPARLD